MKKILYHANKLWMLTLVGIMFYELIVNGKEATFAQNLIILSIIIVCSVPYLIKKLLKYEMSEILKFVYFLFIFMAIVLGSVYNFYRTITWFDLFVHFLFGVFTSFIALIIIKRFMLLKKSSVIFQIIFIVAFTVAIAAFWEYFEFLSDKILKRDSQWVLLTGVDDTMTDMLIASLASWIFSLFYYISNKKIIKKIDKVL